MKFLGMGVPELLIILAVVLLIFGPKHLPKLGSAIGSTVKNLRDGLGANKKDEEEDEEDIIDVEEEEEKPVAKKSTKRIPAETAKKPRRKAPAKEEEPAE